MMKWNLLLAAGLAAAIAAAGCTKQPLATGPSATSQSELGFGQNAAVRLQLDWGRQVQSAASEVTGATISVEVGGQAPVVKSFPLVPFSTDTLDVDALKPGDAKVTVDVYAGAKKIGTGWNLVPLLAGRRSSVRIGVYLDNSGRTMVLPMTPLGNIPDPKERLFIQKVRFHTASTLADYKQHELILKNNTNQNIYLFDTVIAFHPTTTASVATSSLYTTNSNRVYFIQSKQTLRVFLDNQATPTSTEARTDFAPGTVQYSAGGALALLNAPVNGPQTMLDFVQWGRSGTLFEPQAATAGLWTAGTFVAVPSVTGYAGAEASVTSEGATGSVNWTMTTLAL